jgi:hypothetical protein
MTFNISKEVAEITAPKLNLADYEVCKWLCPFVSVAIGGVGNTISSASRIEITPEYVRAYPKSETNDKPSFAQKNLPKGLYDACVDISAGPTHPFPVAKVSSLADDEKLPSHIMDWKKELRRHCEAARNHVFVHADAVSELLKHGELGNVGVNPERVGVFVLQNRLVSVYVSKNHIPEGYIRIDVDEMTHGTRFKSIAERRRYVGA